MTEFHDESNSEERNAGGAAFERELRGAMKRVNAPETLAKFLVLAAEAEEQRKLRGGVAVVNLSNGGKVLAFPRQQAWVAGAIAAALLLSVSIGEVARVHRERERAEATRQYETAMRITEHSLEHARVQLRRAGIHLEE